MLSWKDTDVCIIDINTTYSCREGHRFLQLMDGGGGGGGGGEQFIAKFILIIKLLFWAN